MKLLKYDEKRKRMVQEQLVPRGIKDKKVLEVFAKVPRHKFLSEELLFASYQDHPLPIGCGQTISQPYMVALMTESLLLKGGEKVLEIGTGSGYQAAILAEIAKEVYSIECIAELSCSAKKALDELGYENIFLKVGDGTLGWEEKAPFDGIIVTAGSPNIPQTLINQLKEGGRLIMPVGSAFGQMLIRVTKTKQGLKQEDICACVFVPLIGKYGWTK